LPIAAANLPIEVIDANSGHTLSRVTPQGTPLALALASRTLAMLERGSHGVRLAWYARANGAPLGSVPVSVAASPELTASDRVVVFRVGRSIRAVDLGTRKVRVLAKAAATPVDLSLEGTRLAWAENLVSGARIRALYLDATP
ncbi:MAG: hypothetical protein QOF43_1245, partial [Gaiellaceae bacterium]|nr:hypothetical protein [Gaiellaceae bacterium]